MVFAAGSPRHDKGCFRLGSIAAEYLKRYPDDREFFRIPNMRDDDIRPNLTYAAQLAATPNVELGAAVLSDEAIDCEYRASDFLIMPYDFAVYRLRGSAVFTDALEADGFVQRDAGCIRERDAGVGFEVSLGGEDME